MTASKVTNSGEPDSSGSKRRPLSGREREILGRLAEGLSGAQIAKELVLSPETVRTHVRNAMEKLGAATRSQAVAIALESGQIGDAGNEAVAGEGRPQLATPGIKARAASGPTLTALLAGVASIADIESGAVYFAEDGMLLRLAAHSAGPGGAAFSPPAEITLGTTGIGRVALERRAQLVPAERSSFSAPPGPQLAAPMSARGRLLGVLVLGVRSSRPTSRRELLLLEAFASRIAEILVAGAEPQPLSRAFKRFRASWTGTLDV